MNVSELRKCLEKYPDTLSVYVDGYEDGVEDLKIENIKERMIKRNAHTESYYGDHDALPFWSEYPKSGYTESGLVLSR